MNAVEAGEPGMVAYVEAVASAAPTPGGGSVAAVVGALAAALGEMVVNLTVGRPAAAAVEADLRRALTALGETRRTLLALAVADEEAYGGYLTATGLPKGSAEEKAARTAAMQAALLRSADVPRRVADACLALFPILEGIARTGNKHVLSDAAIAGILAEAAVRASAVNVRVNARSLHDAVLAGDLLRLAAAAEETARGGATAVLDLTKRC